MNSHFYSRMLFLVLSVFSVKTLYPQLVKPSQFVDLSAGGIKAVLLNGGDMFNTFSSTKGYEFPKVTGGGPSRGTIAAAALWIGAYDETNTLRVAAMLYRQSGYEYYPGPITSDSVNSTLYYDKIYGVSANDLLRQKQSGNTDIANNLLEWPIKDNIFFSSTRYLAPFYDNDSDGFYSPYNGDYPLINGEQAFYMIFNDKGPHSESLGLPLEVDVEAMFYSFPSSDTALNNTVFVNYSITNRSKHIYHDFFIALWVDFDIGNYADDYMGCDTTRNMFFGYNGDDNDEGEYGLNPPAQGLVFLDHKLSRFYSYENISTGINGNPDFPLEYYRAITALNLDGSPVLDNNNKPTKFSYYGKVGETGDYNGLNSGKAPTDLRSIGAIGPYIVGPDESVCFDAAFISARNLNSNDKVYRSVNTLKRYTDDIQNLYDEGKILTKNILCRGIHTLDIKSAGEVEQLNMYPNPGRDIIHLSGLSVSGQSLVEIYSSDGRLVFSVTISENETDIDLTNFEAGIYNMVVTENARVFNGHFIKE